MGDLNDMLHVSLLYCFAFLLVINRSRMTQWLNVMASQAGGPGFESRWEHSSFSLKSPDFVPVAPRVALSLEWDRRELKKNYLFITAIFSKTGVHNSALALAFCLHYWDRRKVMVQIFLRGVFAEGDNCGTYSHGLFSNAGRLLPADIIAFCDHSWYRNHNPLHTEIHKHQFWFLCYKSQLSKHPPFSFQFSSICTFDQSCMEWPAMYRIYTRNVVGIHSREI